MQKNLKTIFFVGRHRGTSEIPKKASSLITESKKPVRSSLRSSRPCFFPIKILVPSPPRQCLPVAALQGRIALGHVSPGLPVAEFGIRDRFLGDQGLSNWCDWILPPAKIELSYARDGWPGV